MKIIGIIIIIIIVLLLSCYVNHRVQSQKEEPLLKPLGTMVTVNSKKMSIFSKGEGTKTLVFMSGGGTCSPILMFCSNGNGTGLDEETWRKIQTKYVSNCGNAEIIEMDCGHYIHNYEYGKIANEIREFLK